eukprot:scaffold2129_cov255-Pinguiococcus_pyrenoidosus.AAC.3
MVEVGGKAAAPGSSRIEDQESMWPRPIRPVANRLSQWLPSVVSDDSTESDRDLQWSSQHLAARRVDVARGDSMHCSPPQLRSSTWSLRCHKGS